MDEEPECFLVYASCAALDDVMIIFESLTVRKDCDPGPFSLLYSSFFPLLLRFVL